VGMDEVWSSIVTVFGRDIRIRTTYQDGTPGAIRPSMHIYVSCVDVKYMVTPDGFQVGKCFVEICSVLFKFAGSEPNLNRTASIITTTRFSAKQTRLHKELCV